MPEKMKICFPVRKRNYIVVILAFQLSVLFYGLLVSSFKYSKFNILVPPISIFLSLFFGCTLIFTFKYTINKLLPDRRHLFLRISLVYMLAIVFFLFFITL
jgi:hypothetical protein